MIWLITLLFFMISMALTWLAFILYARSFRAIGHANDFLKHIASLLIYSLFAAFIVTPLILGLMLLPDVNQSFSEESVFMVFYLSCYILSLLPGLFYFKHVHLKSLRELGFFNKM